MNPSDLFGTFKRGSFFREMGVSLLEMFCVTMVWSEGNEIDTGKFQERAVA